MTVLMPAVWQTNRCLPNFISEAELTQDTPQCKSKGGLVDYSAFLGINKLKD